MMLMEIRSHTRLSWEAVPNFQLADFRFRPTRAFSGTPTNDDVGSISVRVTAQDGSGVSAYDEFTLGIINVNDAPIALSDAYTVSKGQKLSITSAQGVLANDGDIDVGDGIQAQLVKSTTNGALTFNADGSFTYVPTKSFTAVDTFTDKAWDGEAFSLVKTVSIGVLSGPNTNPTPVTVNGNYVGTKNAEIITGNDANNVIDGAGGDDRIDGKGGTDRLIGGSGDDYLTGGVGCGHLRVPF